MYFTGCAAVQILEKQYSTLEQQYSVPEKLYQEKMYCTLEQLYAEATIQIH
jgi:hypothetical protein